ncbi:unnamed protein product [Ilex paraguariensis]|uniref:FLZ-type domain-containing protein n=1 Tax=Ilex paraguariensis TaxID=185542 RepID=A0ABC8S2E5_9AQUA
MPVKRSGIGRSSSFSESNLLDHVSLPIESWEMRTAPPSASVKPPNNPNKVLKTSVVEKVDQSRPKILTLSSPVQESVDQTDTEMVGGFLKNCYYCKKKILEDAEVFMYGYLRAFCTAECRDMQIALEKAAEEQSANRMMVEGHSAIWQKETGPRNKVAWGPVHKVP